MEQDFHQRYNSEATKAVMKKALGIAEAIRYYSLQITKELCYQEQLLALEKHSYYKFTRKSKGM